MNMSDSPHSSSLDGSCEHVAGRRQSFVMLLDPAYETRCLQISKEFIIPLITPQQYEAKNESPVFLLFFEEDKLTLKSTVKNFGSPISIDFLTGKLWHRYRYGGGRGQLIAKAVGIKSGFKPIILDLTAGLGQDAFVLASLGCTVTMLERSPVIAALLQDALMRGKKEPWFSELKLNLIFTEAKNYLISLEKENQPDIIYFDPMFPSTKKTALVKKEMRMLRDLLGDDLDADELLTQALKSARKKVVVKRPRLAKFLGEKAPDLTYEGKSSRFDVYFGCDYTDPSSRVPSRDLLE
jgi:16S rRNA (guanine1516-N2)-methyltransferase